MSEIADKLDDLILISGVAAVFSVVYFLFIMVALDRIAKALESKKKGDS